MQGEHPVDSSSRIGRILRNRPVSEEVFPGPPPEVVRRWEGEIERLISFPEAIEAHSNDPNFDRSAYLALEWLNLSQAPPTAPPPVVPPAEQSSAEATDAPKQPLAKAADAPEAAAKDDEEDENTWNTRGYKDPDTGEWIQWPRDEDSDPPNQE